MHSNLCDEFASFIVVYSLTKIGKLADENGTTQLRM